MTSKILTLLGFASKSGSLSFGMDSTIKSIHKNKCQAIFIADDVSPKSQKEINFHANNNITIFKLPNITIEILSKAVGRRCGIISINDSSFADAIAKAITTGGNANDQ